MLDNGSRDQVLLLNRRPIFDLRMKVRYYELNPGPRTGSRRDWLRDLAGEKRGRAGEGFLESLAGGKRAVLRLEPEEILGGGLEFLPQGWLVWPRAAGEKVRPSLTAACRRIKRQERGLVLGVDLARQSPELAGLADILAVEQRPGREPFAGKEPPRGSGAVLMAVNLDREADLVSAAEMGCRLFQGRFYATPDPDPGRTIPKSRLTQLRLLCQIHSPSFDLDSLEETVAQDVSLAHRLLRYINSPFFGLTGPISSIRQALVLLGEEEIRHWLSLAVLAEAGEGKPDELVVLSLVRAHFFAETGRLIGRGGQKGELFLTGLFSLLDVFFDRPLARLLVEIPLKPEIKDALLGGGSVLRIVVELCLAYEAGSWEYLSRAAKELNLDQGLLLKAYHFSVTRAREFFDPLASGV